MPASEVPSPHLQTLLSQALVAYTIEFDNTAEEWITAAGRRPWMASLVMMRLRGASQQILRGLDLELPRHGPVVSYAMFAEVVPPSGPPPPQAEDDLDLSVLLARALLGFTLRFERGSKLSLPVCANGLRVLGEDAARVRDLPRLTGVSKEAVAMLAGFLARAKLFGADTVAGLRDAPDVIVGAREGGAPLLAQGLAPLPGGWRGERPYLTRTQAVLRDPRGAVPHHPMVLHRGGFPDAS